MEIITTVWNTILLEPVINGLIVISGTLFGSFGLAIIALTIIVRLVTFPLTLKQLRSTKAMSALQPKMQELQKKYSKDKQQLSKEVSKLYKEAGVNPMGCLMPMLVQFPIWIALYQSIMRLVATSPEDLFGLSVHLYSWPLLHHMVPLQKHFLWLDLGSPDRFFILPVLVGGSMWVMQKMSTITSADPKQQQMSRMMTIMMPLMFAFFTLQFPSGLALYWVASNIIGIITQYFVTGWGSLLPAKQVSKEVKRISEPVAEPKAFPSPDVYNPTTEARKREAHGKFASKRKDRRRSHRTRPR